MPNFWLSYIEHEEDLPGGIWVRKQSKIICFSFCWLSTSLGKPWRGRIWMGLWQDMDNTALLVIQGIWEKHPCTSASPSVSWRGWTRWFLTAFSALTLQWISINFAYPVYSLPSFWQETPFVLLAYVVWWADCTAEFKVGACDPGLDNRGNRFPRWWSRPEYFISFSHYVMYIGIGLRRSSVSPFWDFQLLRKRMSISARTAEEDRLWFKSCWYLSCHYQGRAYLMMEPTLKKIEPRNKRARLGPDPDNSWNPWIPVTYILLNYKSQ